MKTIVNENNSTTCKNKKNRKLIFEKSGYSLTICLMLCLLIIITLAGCVKFDPAAPLEIAKGPTPEVVETTSKPVEDTPTKAPDISPSPENNDTEIEDEDESGFHDEDITPAPTNKRPSSTYFTGTSGQTLKLENVANLFLHGHGSTYDETSDNKMFLTNDEVLTVINDVVLPYGLYFTINDKSFPIEAKHAPAAVSGNMSDKITRFTADFIDEERDILIEFVSIDDAYNWSINMASSQGYIANTANVLRTQMSDSYGNEYIGVTTGVLYDPCTKADDNETVQVTKARSIVELELQIRSLVIWLFD